MYQTLILNVSLLVALATFYTLLARLRMEGRLWSRLVSGLLFGAVAIVGMSVPFHYAPGVIYDGRSIVLAMAGLFGGGATALVAAVVAGAYRLYLGGGGVWAGVATLASSALVGLAFRRLAGNRPSKLGIPALYLVGLSVHVAMLASQLLVLPWPAGLTAIGRIWLPVILIFPVATVLMGVLLRTEDRRLEIQAGLRESEARHKAILRSATDGFWRIDLQGRILEVNEAYCQMSGYSEEELLTKGVSDLEATAQQADMVAHIQEVLARGSDRFETRHVRKDGSAYPVEVSVQYLPEQGGFLSAFLRDLSRRKQAEEALRASEEQYRDLVEHSQDLICTHDLEGRILSVNLTATRALGYAVEELIHRNLMDLMPPGSDEGFYAYLATIREQGVASGFMKILTHAGEARVWEYNNNLRRVEGETPVVRGMARDVTERRRAERALRKSEERYHAVIELQTELISRWRPDGTLTFVNDAYCRYYGRPREELIGRKWMDVVAEEDRERVKEYTARLKTSLSPANPTVMEEHREIGVDGSIRWQMWTDRALFDEQGRIIEFQSVGRDITERVQAEEARRAQLERVSGHDRALVYLATKGIPTASDFQEAARAITQAASEATGAGRVGVWLLSDEGRKLTCVDLYNEETGHHSHGDILDVARYPGYLDALSSSRVVDAQDALNDPRTSEFRDDYLTPQGITSTLDATIRDSGKVVGVVCFEHAADALRAWQPDELAFAREVADQAALALLNAERQQAEEALRQSEEQYRSLVETSGAGVVSVDLQGKLTFVNQAVSDMFRYSKEELLGRPFADFLHPDDANRVLDLFRSGVRNPGNKSRLEFRIRRPDGGMAYGYTVPTLICHAGQIVGASAIIHDISERRQAEEALRESERRLKEAQAMGKLGHWVFDLESQSIQWSDQVYELYERDPALGPPSPEEEEAYYLPEQAQTLREYARRASETGERFEYDLQARLPSGKIAHFSASMRPIYDERGRANRLLGTVQDITERKQSEAALKQSEARFQSFMRNFPGLAYMKDSDGRVVFASEGFGRYLGLEPADMSGKTNDDLFPAEFAEKITSDDRRVLESGSVDTIEETFAGRTWTTYKFPILQPDGPVLLGGLTTDITRRKRTEQALRQRTAQVRLLFEAGQRLGLSLDMGAILDTVHDVIARTMTCDVLVVSSFTQEDRMIRRLAVYQEGAPLEVSSVPPMPLEEEGQGTQGMSIRSGESLYVADLQRQRHTPQMVQVTGGGQTVAPEKASAGEGATRSALIVPLKWEGGVIGSVQVFSYQPDDFSPDDLRFLEALSPQIAAAMTNARLYQAVQQELGERLRAEEELLRLKEFNEGIVQNMAEGIILEDAGGYLRFANPAAAAMLGYTVEELVGQHWTSLVPPDQQPSVHAANERRSRGESDQYEVELTRKDGARLPVLVSASPHSSGDARVPAGTLAVFANLSELKNLEEQFQQAQKMEAVGRLAGGVAHDFNNLLTVIHLSTRLLENKLRTQDSLRPQVERIREAGDRAASLIRQLLAFSRREIIAPRVLDLNEVVRELDKILRPLIGEDVELRILLGDDLWPAHVDPTQIEQVIINLAVNARDAMPVGGRLTIETANVLLDDSYAARHLDVEPGEYLLLAVSDTGMGMSDEVKAHLFEPFFTTKEKGKGTGLGLATVFGIVKQNKGHVWVYSEPGQGTTFKIYLPRAPQGIVASQLGLAGDAAEAARGSETLLLVEDETEVRQLARDILLAQGYRVLEAQDGMEALQVSEGYEGPIHLLVTDVVMPRMSGRVLADHLRASRPGVRVLYTSGYTDNAIVHHGVLAEGAHFLSKPFDLRDLAQKVREVLEQPA